MTTTIITWNSIALPEGASEIINAQAAQMALDGKTDNNPIRVFTEEGAKCTTTRTWTTLADAEEWILFVEQYTPISATIES